MFRSAGTRPLSSGAQSLLIALAGRPVTPAPAWAAPTPEGPRTPARMECRDSSFTTTTCLCTSQTDSVAAAVSAMT